MSVVTCPMCSETAECAAQSGSVCVCGACGATLVADGDTPTRIAVASDTTALDAEALIQLRRARGAITRQERRQR